MGQVKNDAIIAVDLSEDHKPDLPNERVRIEAAGGVVSTAGPRGLPPSRVWVNGRVGLAMSRSLGDGEAKSHGVIPDPEIKQLSINPRKGGDGDGDKFVIVASDGIWEFISSQQVIPQERPRVPNSLHGTSAEAIPLFFWQACDVVHRHSDATEACTELVRIAEERWREEEGSYRDDITCAAKHLQALTGQSLVLVLV